jgi:hypothetical protein
VVNSLTISEELLNLGDGCFLYYSFYLSVFLNFFIIEQSLKKEDEELPDCNIGNFLNFPSHISCPEDGPLFSQFPSQKSGRLPSPFYLHQPFL